MSRIPTEVEYTDKYADEADEKEFGEDENRDPISGAPGSHPVGTGVGATTGGLAGAAIGSFAGPLGSITGLIIGAVAGGFAGRGVGEAVNPTVEEVYWRENFENRPYVAKGSGFETYRPAYRYGWESWSRHTGKTFEEAEAQMESDWERAAGSSGLSWEQARDAARDSWMRVDQRAEEMEDEYWREHYSSRPYVRERENYDRYRYAYQLGRKAHARYPDKFFDDVEDELKNEWNRIRESLGPEALSWERVAEAVRDGWNHADYGMLAKLDK